MKQTINNKNRVQFEEIYEPITLRSAAGETIDICMRDTGFEFVYAGKVYSAKGGTICLLMKKLSQPTEKLIPLAPSF